ncbi:MAG: ABC transporter transmembrane domain-containing protein, partial [Paracoccaceae bacterium]
MARKKTKKTEDGREKSTTISPLRGLFPFLAPYKGLMIAAAIALVFTASVSLALPRVVREVVDGFTLAELKRMDGYFIGIIIVMGAMAVGTGLRFYFVTKLGERVIADVRMAIYQKVIGLSPAFYEKILTGEVLSRLTTDTTLILSVISSSVSVALRNVLMLGGGMIFMSLTSIKMTGLVTLMVPLVILPIMALGRRLRMLSRESQDRIAESSGEASETLLAAQTVQAYTHEV